MGLPAKSNGLPSFSTFNAMNCTGLSHFSSSPKSHCSYMYVSHYIYVPMMIYVHYIRICIYIYSYMLHVNSCIYDPPNPNCHGWDLWVKTPGTRIPDTIKNSWFMDGYPPIIWINVVIIGFDHPHTYMHIYIYVCMYACMYVCKYNILYPHIGGLYIPMILLVLVSSRCWAEPRKRDAARRRKSRANQAPFQNTFSERKTLVDDQAPFHHARLGQGLQ